VRASPPSTSARLSPSRSPNREKTKSNAGGNPRAPFAFDYSSRARAWQGGTHPHPRAVDKCLENEIAPAMQSHRAARRGRLSVESEGIIQRQCLRDPPRTTYPRYPTYPQADSAFAESIRVAVSGCGRKEADRKRTEVLPAIATADAAEILRGRSRGSDWQGDRGRSVRGNPIPISSKSSKTEAFGRKSREREPAEAAMLRLGTRNAR
jgi:hypothetical protein